MDLQRWSQHLTVRASVPSQQSLSRSLSVAVTTVTDTSSSSNTAKSASSGDEILRVDNAEIIYGGVIQAIRGVSFSVQRGEVVAILGANGAGKTTLLRAISGLLPYHGGRLTGSISIDGRDIAGESPASLVRRGLAQVMEGRRIFGELTVDDNLRAGAFTRKDKAAATQSYDRVMELFPRLAERRKQQAGYMSGGEQQMLAIGRALMIDPKLLLLDEPSLGLAPIIVQQIGQIVLEINKQGTTVLLVEQNANMALSISDRGFIVENGRIAKTGTGQALLGDPDVQALYLGDASHKSSFRTLKTYRATTEDHG